MTKVYSISVTSLRQNPEYTTYYVYVFRLLILGMIPTILLVLFNCKIYKVIQNRNRRQLDMFPGKSKTEVNRRTQSKQEQKTSTLFTAIVILFLVCHSPRNILSMVEAILIRNSNVCKNATITLQELGVADPLRNHFLYEFPIWVYMVTSVSELLLVIDASINMFLYTLFNNDFRQHIAKIMGSIANLVGIPCFPCTNRFCRKVNNQENDSKNIAKIQIKIDGTDNNGKNPQ